MVFSDQIFLFLFLPITLIVYWLIVRASSLFAVLFLCVASIFFYGFFRPEYILLISLSILGNYLCYKYFLTKNGLFIGVLLNVALIAYYKYSQFFVEDVFKLEIANFSYPVLPLAISFFTFQQISFLVDQSKTNDKSVGFLDYFAYVSFFPQLIAGPIVRHDEFLHQVRKPDISIRNTLCGFVLFAIGLTKKVLIADNVSPLVAKGFDPANLTTAVDGWVGALSYTIQIYYDFSGYSDMAIGIALMFGFILPWNFNSPYKSLSIQDFWRRWHMTLSRWLKDYVYIALGGNRKGNNRRQFNLAATMLIGGLWHGASWNFVIWGGLHGLALMIHRYWSDMGGRLPKIIAWVITFVFVVNLWVLFRAPDFATSLAVLDKMWIGGWSADMASSQFSKWVLGALVAIIAVTLILPSSQKIAENAVGNKFYARITLVVIIVLFMMSLKQVLSVGAPSEFIYFQF